MIRSWEVLLRPAHSVNVIPCLHSDVLLALYSAEPASGHGSPTYILRCPVSWGTLPLRGTVQHDVLLQSPSSVRLIISSSVLITFDTKTACVLSAFSMNAIHDVGYSHGMIVITLISSNVTLRFPVSESEATAMLLDIRNLKSKFSVRDNVETTIAAASSSLASVDEENVTKQRSESVLAMVFESKNFITRCVAKIKQLESMLAEKEEELQNLKNTQQPHAHAETPR
eukprot:PhF_6_TR27854/c0_g1_i1/m.40697